MSHLDQPRTPWSILSPTGVSLLPLSTPLVSRGDTPTLEDPTRSSLPSRGPRALAPMPSTSPSHAWPRNFPSRNRSRSSAPWPTRLTPTMPLQTCITLILTLIPIFLPLLTSVVASMEVETEADLISLFLLPLSLMLTLMLMLMLEVLLPLHFLTLLPLPQPPAQVQVLPASPTTLTTERPLKPLRPFLLSSLSSPPPLLPPPLLALPPLFSVLFTVISFSLFFSLLAPSFVHARHTTGPHEACCVAQKDEEEKRKREHKERKEREKEKAMTVGTRVPSSGFCQDTTTLQITSSLCNHTSTQKPLSKTPHQEEEETKKKKIGGGGLACVCVFWHLFVRDANE